MRSLALRVNRSARVQTRVSPKILGWGLVALLVCLPLFSQTNHRPYSRKHYRPNWRGPKRGHGRHHRCAKRGYANRDHG